MVLKRDTPSQRMHTDPWIRKFLYGELAVNVGNVNGRGQDTVTPSLPTGKDVIKTSDWFSTKDAVVTPEPPPGTTCVPFTKNPEGATTCTVWDVFRIMSSTPSL
jgi:hypothetical protein